MSKLSHLMAKSEKITVGGIELDIKPLTVKDLGLVMDLDPDHPSPEKMKELVFKVLKDSVPDATEEEMDNMGVQYLNEIMTAVSKVNNLGAGDSPKNKMVQRLKGAKGV